MSFAGSVNWSRAAAELADNDKVQIADALVPDFAESVGSELAAEKHWDVALTTKQGPIRIDHTEWVAMPAARRATLQENLRRQSRSGFSFAYFRRDVAPLEDSAPFVERFAEFIGSDAFMDQMRSLTGESDLRYADAHAALYQPGSFLKTHDDTYAGKNRRFAYVMNLSRRWDADWGGLLHFGAEGTRRGTYFVPTFNTLAVFRVPQNHFVSQVATFAGGPRLSITGWLFA